MTTMIEENRPIGSAPADKIIVPLWHSHGPMQLLLPRFEDGETVSYFRSWAHPFLASFVACQNGAYKEIRGLKLGARFEFDVSYSVINVRDPWYIERNESTRSIRVSSIHDIFSYSLPEELRLALFSIADKELNESV